MRKREVFAVLPPVSDRFTTEDVSKLNRSVIDHGGISLMRMRGCILRLICHSSDRFTIEGVSESNGSAILSRESLLVRRRMGGKFRHSFSQRPFHVSHSKAFGVVK